MDQDVKTYSVSEITQDLKNLIEESFFDFWVYGEVSNFRGTNISGHLYFNLKDKDSVLPSVIFKNDALRCAFAVSEGAMVQARGRLSLYAPQGRYQLIIKEIRPWGLGNLHIKFEGLKKKLEEEGLFDENRKRPLPAFPNRVGIVTSPTGAVIRDIINGFSKRYPCINIIINPVRVQGDRASEEISEAIKELNKSNYNLDFIIIARGGGSIEDLWAFNEEVVARAIYESRVPIVSAVGHMTDYTISDFVADIRASTPSNATEITTQDRTELLKRLSITLNDLISFSNFRMDEKIESLNELKNSRLMRFPERIYDSKRELLSGLTEKLCYLIENKLNLTKNKNLEIEKIRFIENSKSFFKNLNGVVDNLKTSLYNLNPYGILERGYAIAKDKNGNLLFDSESVNIGDIADITLYKGEIKCRVEDRK